jgi:hypothetical protein
VTGKSVQGSVYINGHGETERHISP